MTVNLMKVAFVAVFALALGGQPGCKKANNGTPEAKRAARQEAATSLGSGAFFKHIPKESPYVFASFKSIPEEIFVDMLEPMGTFWEIVAERIEDDIKGNSKEDKVGRAVMKELRGKINKEGLLSLGISTSPEFAIYGMGPLPVVRLEIKDGTKFRAALDRIAKDADDKIPWKSSGDIRYLSTIEKDAAFVFAPLDESLVFAVVPTETLEESLPLLFGTQTPKESMADGAYMRELAARHGFGPYGLGYVDFGRLYEAATGKLSGETMKYWQALTKGEWLKPPQGCVPHIEKLTGELIPRVVFGYGDLDRTTMSFSFLVELAPALGLGLRALTVGMPGLTDATIENSMFSLGGGLQIKNAQNTAKLVAWYLEKIGNQCEAKELKRVAKDLVDFSRLPIPKEIGDELGILLSVIDGDFDLNGKDVKNVNAFALIELGDPAHWIETANQSSGGMVTLTVPADGKFHKQNFPFIPPEATDGIFLAIKDKILMFAAGEKGKSAALAALKDIPKHPPFGLIRYDMSKLADIVDEVASLEESPSAREAANLLMDAWSQWSHVGIKLHATDNAFGLTFTSEKKL